MWAKLIFYVLMIGFAIFLSAEVIKFYEWQVDRAAATLIHTQLTER
jgi:hypothetical protein